METSINLSTTKVIPTMEELMNRSLLMQMRAKKEKKYEEQQEILDLYNQAVEAMMERDDEGELFPSIFKAVNCMSMAACHGMKEAKKVMKDLEHIAKFRVPLELDGYSDECIKAVDEYEESIKAQIEKVIKNAEMEGEKSLKSFKFIISPMSQGELFLNYPYPIRLDDKSLRTFLLAAALGSAKCESCENEDDVEKEWGIAHLKLNRSLQMCLETEEEWALDLMVFTLSHIAELNDSVGAGAGAFYVYSHLYNFLYDTYVAENLQTPYSLNMYMNAKERENHDAKIEMWVLVVIKRMYSCLMRDENDVIEGKEDWLTIISHVLWTSLSQGLDSYDGNIAYQLVDIIWKKKDDESSLYSLLMCADSPEEVMDNWCEVLRNRIINPKCLISEDYSDSVFTWYDFEWDGLRSALNWLKEGNSKLNDENNAFCEAAAFGLFTAVLARRGDAGLEGNIECMVENVKQLQRGYLIEMTAFAIYVYHTNQGEHNVAYSEAIELIRLAGMEDSELAHAIEERLAKGMTTPIH